MNASPNCVKLIESFEGFSPTMYYDAANLPTIGYGTLIDEDDEQWLMTANISRQQAEELLKKELYHTEKILNILLKGVQLNQNQYDSLCSFTYNVGSQNFKKSTLYRKIKVRPSDPTIRSEFLRWVYANGKKLQGLVDRRTKEANLYYDID